ncbi:hypothetical protein HY065_03160 [Candidatus Berkelbacteria bacterium]|nr:hypothetical protein [Candidatus Berkelbacteria bacterium]
MDNFIYLEPDEEIPSVVKKIKKSQEQSFGLVVPRGSITFQSAINLKLLKKQAELLKKEIAVITADPVGQHLAAQAGLVVFESMKSQEPLAVRQQPDTASSKLTERPEPHAAIERSADGVTVRHFQTETIEPERHYEPPQRSNMTATHMRPRRLWLLIPALLMIAAIYLFVVPRATIMVDVLGEPFQRELTLKAATVSSSSNEPVIAATFQEDSAALSKTFKTTGQKDVGQKAKSTITFFNAWSSDPQSLAAGTKLTKDGQAFRLLQGITIPGASVTLAAGQAQTNPGQLKGDIEAEASGESGNVAAGRFIIPSIEVVKQSKIYAESSAKLSGGSSKFIGVVSADDIKNAKTSLQTDLKNQLKDELVKKVAGQIILDQAVSLATSDEQVSKKEGDEASEFSLSMKGDLKAIAFTETEFRKTFLAALASEIGPDKEVTFGANDEIVTTVDDADFDNGKLTIKGSLKSQIAPKLDQSALKNELRFKSLAAAEDILRAQRQVSNVSITLWPAHALKRIPLLPTNITFEIQHK